MLLDVNNVKVITLNPDAPNDYDEFAGIEAFAFANNKLEPRSAADIQQ